MKQLIVFILSLTSFQLISQECSQISIDNIDHSNTGTATVVYITEDGNGDFYFQDANSLKVNLTEKISIIVDDERFFEFYHIVVIASETNEKLVKEKSVKLCDSEYSLAIKVGEKTIQSKSITLK